MTDLFGFEMHRDAEFHGRNRLTLTRRWGGGLQACAAHQVFVCWGAIAWDDLWIDHVVEEIQSGEGPYPALWCWGMTSSGAPKHPMARGKHRIPADQKEILWKAAGI